MAEDNTLEINYRPFFFKIPDPEKPLYITLWDTSYLSAVEVLHQTSANGEIELGKEAIENAVCVDPPVYFPGSQQDLLMTVDAIENGKFENGSLVYWDSKDNALIGCYLVRGSREGTVVLEGEGPHGTETHVADINEVYYVTLDTTGDARP